MPKKTLKKDKEEAQEMKEKEVNAEEQVIGQERLMSLVVKIN